MSQISDEEFEITVYNKLESLPVIAQFLNDSLQKIGMGEDKIFDMNVAVDEACTNIIQHAYSPDERGKIEIRCKVVNDNRCAVSIKDNGKPYDQSTEGPADTTSPLEERKPGGLGLFFMRELVDEIFYEYKDGFETLTLIKSLS
jgi:serine/threonine-protein kinase RsbW